MPSDPVKADGEFVAGRLADLFDGWGEEPSLRDVKRAEPAGLEQPGSRPMAATRAA